MACIQNIPPANVDSEREEGEIVDELDDLSDISSGEENLLLQRLHVLESYNHVLERKEAKRSSFGTGNLNVKEAYPHFNKLTEETSLFDFNDEISTKEHGKTVNHKHKSKDVLSKEQIFPKYKDKRRKPHRQKKKVEPKITKESSDESDHEYRNKRRKLENAVSVTKTKTDSSLKARLMQMLCASQNLLAPIEVKTVEKAISQIKEADCKNNEKCDIENSSSNLHDNVKDPEKLKVDGQCTVEDTELINLSSDDGSIQIVPCTEIVAMSVDENLEMKITAEDKKQCKTEEASDEDLELLRQCALKSKTLKNLEINKETLHEPVNLVSEDEDSDTAELRLICLRSALLKKAIEMKQKQKLRRKLSQSTLYDDVISNEPDLPENKIENNTDTESVDMEIGSDDPGHDDKDDNVSNNIKEDNLIERQNEDPDKNKLAEDDIEEDEDLLRAKLLTSLSKNLPNLVDSNKLENLSKTEATVSKEENLGLPDSKQVIQNQTPEEKRFIIHTGDSDSDEPEATKNLTKMHLKLSEQPDFQQKLDQFLKSARMEVENTKLPDLVQQPPNVSLQKKFIPKALKHLPKNEMIEYNKLVKRMAELEKLKKVRLSMTFWDNELKGPVLKEALKSRNVTVDTNTPLTQSVLDEEIALSRKKIAEESAKVLRLKEEHTNLIQKYKIVETELRNLSTAITFNKRSQKLAQIQFSKSRAKHQMLLKRSTTLNYNNHYSTPQLNTFNRSHNKVNMSSKLQKENEPLKVQQFDKFDLKSVKVSVVNDLKDQAKQRIPEDRLSIQIDVANNKKIVKIPKEISQPNEGKGIDDVRLDKQRDVQIDDGEENTQNHSSKADDIENDYKSPLQALTSAGWNEDPNGVLCPFDVGGSCKDANCKYLHPKDSSH